MPQTLSEWLRWLETLHAQEIDLGLDRISRVARTLLLIDGGSSVSGHYLHDAKVITVAGTNGKGSCVKTLSNILLSKNQRVGCYTSPHFMHFSERITIDNVPVTDDDICRAFSAIEQAREVISLTYFEFSTLAALWLFKQADVDYCLLEVGLGGRLDATNIVDADLAIITSIDLDHQDWLGDTRELIALEKAGIKRQGKPLVSSVFRPPSTLQRVYREHSPSYCIGKDFFIKKEPDGYLFNSPVVGRPEKDSGVSLTLGSPRLPLASVACAVMAALLLEQLPEPNHLKQVIANSQLPGRLERYQLGNKLVTLDVAHNPAAARHLVEHLKPQKCAIVFAIMADKDVRATLEALQELSHAWYFGALDLERAMATEQVVGVLEACKQFDNKHQTVSTYNTVADAFKAALESEYHHILVAGSFYTVTAVMPVIETFKETACG